MQLFSKKKLTIYCATFNVAKIRQFLYSITTFCFVFLYGAYKNKCSKILPYLCKILLHKICYLVVTTSFALPQIVALSSHSRKNVSPAQKPCPLIVPVPCTTFSTIKDLSYPTCALPQRVISWQLK